MTYFTRNIADYFPSFLIDNEGITCVKISKEGKTSTPSGLRKYFYKHSLSYKNATFFKYNLMLFFKRVEKYICLSTRMHTSENASIFPSSFTNEIKDQNNKQLINNYLEFRYCKAINGISPLFRFLTDTFTSLIVFITKPFEKTVRCKTHSLPCKKSMALLYPIQQLNKEVPDYKNPIG